MQLAESRTPRENQNVRSMWQQMLALQACWRLKLGLEECLVPSGVDAAIMGHPALANHATG